jgi:hypothetical protein
MSDHRATSEHLANMPDAALDDSDYGYVTCLLELFAKVHTLEQRCEVQLLQLSDLQERQHRLILQVGHLEHELVRDDDDEPQQYCLEAMDPPEANSKPTPNDRQIRTSLVKRVHSCIVGEPPVGHMQARSVIREVAAWMREQRSYPSNWFAQILEKELNDD